MQPRPDTYSFNKGLDAAILLLTQTAEDFEQSLAYLPRGKLHSHMEQTAISELTVKAQLLRGQANHISNLKQK